MRLSSEYKEIYKNFTLKYVYVVDYEQQYLHVHIYNNILRYVTVRNTLYSNEIEQAIRKDFHFQRTESPLHNEVMEHVAHYIKNCATTQFVQLYGV